MDLPNPADILRILQLLTPGIIITTIRARAASGRTPNLQSSLLEFAIISVIYSAIAMPIFSLEGGVEVAKPIWDLLYSIITPTLVGVCLAYLRGYQLTYRAADVIKLPIAHHLPTAWEYAFDSMPAGTHILVTMKDGTKIPGKLGKNSFASTSDTDRDILIEEVWEISDDGDWSKTDPHRNILICDKEIKFVEFF